MAYMLSMNPCISIFRGEGGGRFIVYDTDKMGGVVVVKIGCEMTMRT